MRRLSKKEKTKNERGKYKTECKIKNKSNYSIDYNK
jgi:hypothetical protein